MVVSAAFEIRGYISRIREISAYPIWSGKFYNIAGSTKLKERSKGIIATKYLHNIYDGPNLTGVKPRIFSKGDDR